MINVAVISIVACSLFRVSSGYYHEGPVIGVLTQELLPSLQKAYPNYTSYIAASYVKAIEGAGARAVPIFIGRNYNYYKKQFSLLNGVVLPGGGSSFYVKKGYTEAGSIIYKLAIQANKKKDYFPILGVCLGFELLLHLANDRKELRTKCNASNIALSLAFTKGFKKSRLFGEADPNIISILANSPVTANHHTLCITPKTMSANRLNRSWRTLSLNNDSMDITFVSSVESIKYPFAAVQWHPEKSMYEWKEEQNNPHSREAVLAERHFYDWIANESSKNRHKYPSNQMKKDALIENYPVFYSGGKDLYFEQVYLFN